MSSEIVLWSGEGRHTSIKVAQERADDSAFVRRNQKQTEPASCSACRTTISVHVGVCCAGYLVVDDMIYRGYV